MTLASDLLEQAEHLATVDARRPRQASLRRSISAAYYSLFHLITEESAAQIARLNRLRPAVARAFGHRDLFKTASAITNIDAGNQHWLHSRRYVTTPVDPQLVSVCSAFADLQTERHSADYDGSRTFVRSEALNVVSLARTAHTDWGAIRNTENALVFMLASAGLLRDR